MPRQPLSDRRVYIEVLVSWHEIYDAKTMTVLASVPDGIKEHSRAAIETKSNAKLKGSAAHHLMPTKLFLVLGC